MTFKSPVLKKYEAQQATGMNEPQQRTPHTVMSHNIKTFHRFKWQTLMDSVQHNDLLVKPWVLAFIWMPFLHAPPKQTQSQTPPCDTSTPWWQWSQIIRMNPTIPQKLLQTGVKNMTKGGVYLTCIVVWVSVGCQEVCTNARTQDFPTEHCNVTRWSM